MLKTSKMLKTTTVLSTKTTSNVRLNVIKKLSPAIDAVILTPSTDKDLLGLEGLILKLTLTQYYKQNLFKQNLLINYKNTSLS